VADLRQRWSLWSDERPEGFVFRALLDPTADQLHLAVAEGVSLIRHAPPGIGGSDALDHGAMSDVARDDNLRLRRGFIVETQMRASPRRARTVTLEALV